VGRISAPGVMCDFLWDHQLGGDANGLGVEDADSGDRQLRLCALVNSIE
jgi:hypothetical protein